MVRRDEMMVTRRGPSDCLVGLPARRAYVRPGFNKGTDGIQFLPWRQEGVSDHADILNHFGGYGRNIIDPVDHSKGNCEISVAFLTG